MREYNAFLLRKGLENMVIDKKTPFGKINISTDVVASVAGEAAATCYGVIGLADRNNIREGIAELLKQEDYEKGVYCRKKKDGYEVDVHIIVAYGVKITEVLRGVQKKVAYDLKKAFGCSFLEVNVYVQDIREIN